MSAGNIIHQPSSRTRVYEEIVSTIMQQIADGTLRPGSKLPSERKLAETYHASRTAVREAIQTLATRGYVESRVGDGTFIKNISLDGTMDSFPEEMPRDKKLIKDVLDVRILLEQESAKQAAGQASAEDLALLREAIEKMQAQVDAGNTGLDEDKLFHHRLAKASGNEAIERILMMCEDFLMSSTQLSLARPGRPQESVDDHRVIYQAVASRDPARAMTAIKEHLEKGYFI